MDVVVLGTRGKDVAVIACWNRDVHYAVGHVRRGFEANITATKSQGLNPEPIQAVSIKQDYPPVCCSAVQT